MTRAQAHYDNIVSSCSVIVAAARCRCCCFGIIYSFVFLVRAGIYWDSLIYIPKPFVYRYRLNRRHLRYHRQYHRRRRRRRCYLASSSRSSLDEAYLVSSSFKT